MMFTGQQKHLPVEYLRGLLRRVETMEAPLDLPLDFLGADAAQRGLVNAVKEQAINSVALGYCIVTDKGLPKVADTIFLLTHHFKLPAASRQCFSPASSD